MEDERDDYMLEKVCILNNQQVNAQIFYAINFGGNKLKFVQTDLLFCNKWI